MKRETDKFLTIVRSIKLLFQQLIEQGDSKSAMCKDQPNSTINQALINICGTLPNREYTFSSSTHRAFTKTDCILEHKPNLNPFKRI